MRKKKLTWWLSKTLLGRHRILFTLEGGGGEIREQINSLAAQ